MTAPRFYFATRPETTFGVENPSAFATFFDVASADIKPDAGSVGFPEVVDRSNVSPYKSQYLPKGGFEGVVDTRNIGTIFRDALGIVTTTTPANAVTTRLHTFTSHESTLPSFTSYIGKDIYEQCVVGCIMNSFEIEIPSDTLATVSTEIIASRDRVNPTRITFATPSRRHVAWTRTTSTFGAIPLRVKNIGLSYNNNATLEVLHGSQFPVSLELGKKEIEVSCDLEFRNRDMITAFWGGATEPTLSVTFTNLTIRFEGDIIETVVVGAVTHTFREFIEFVMPNAVVTEVDIPVEGAESITQSVKIIPAAVGAALDLTIRLQNGVLSYT